MGPLRELDLQVSYRSDIGNIVDLFFIPCLERAVSYRRAVGFFTSSGLAMAAKGLAAFIGGPGKMCLIASPLLDENDCKAIAHGYEARHDIIARSLLRCLDGDIDSLVRDRLASLAWLVAHERLEVKIALKKTVPGSPFPVGIYHEKLGIFEDADGNKVAFSGSSNETSGGLIDNFEAVDVFWTWDDPQGRVALKEHNFEDLWNNRTAKLDVMPFPEAAYARLLQFKPRQPPNRDPESETGGVRTTPTRKPLSGFAIPEDVKLRQYQRTAIEAWFKNSCHGVFEMATGTGKTVTALAAAAELFQRERVLGIVILAPFIHLVDQWEEVAAAFGLTPLKCYEDSASWAETFSDQITDLNIRARPVFCVIATHHTASRRPFVEAVKQVKSPLLLIADEVHHLGALSLSQGLPESAKFRLGLSATPDRWCDPEGSQILTNYFSKTVFSFPLQQAIAEGYLCHYEYHPYLVTLEEDEVQNYETLTLQIAKLWGRSVADERAQTKLGYLLRERSDVLNCARKKIDALRQLVRDPEHLRHALFYCAPGQIDDVVHLLASDLKMRVRRFTAEETRQERQALLEEFDCGDMQALVAMKCLDEGVDVPATTTAYILASSSNPREFIQRRGRILRTYPNKRRAVIYDLIAAPPQPKPGTVVSESERSILRRELARFKEFASAADNEYDATAIILDIAACFHILDF